MPQLIFYIEGGYPEIYNLTTRKATIGRNEDTDIHLNDPRVSPHHAELVRVDAGIYQLKDLGSTNGTAVNGKLIEEITLKNGDHIKFGSANAAYVDQSESAEDKWLRQNVERDMVAKTELLAKIEGAIESRTLVLNTIPDSESRLASLEKALIDLGRQAETEANRLSTVQGDLENTRKKREDLYAEVKARGVELENLEKERAELQREFRRIHATNENSVRIKEELHAEVEALHNEVAQAKAALEERVAAYETAQTTIAEAAAIEARMDKLGTDLKSREIAYEEINATIAARESIRARLDSDIAERTLELNELLSSLDAKRLELDQVTREVNDGKERIKASCGLLEEMEATLQKEIVELTKSREMREALFKESGSLSNLISGKNMVLKRINDKIEVANLGGQAETICRPLRVINPEMRALVHYFQHGAGVPDQDRTNPVGFFGLTACTRGSMHKEIDTIPAGDDPVLLMLHGDVEKDYALIQSVFFAMPDRLLLVSWAEGLLDKMIAKLGQTPDPSYMNQILAGVAGIISVDARTAELIGELMIERPHINLPLPSPVEFPEWNAPAPMAARTRGIFVCVNKFNPKSQLHRSRVELLNQLVAETGSPVTMYRANPVPSTVEGLAVPEHLITEYVARVKYGECLNLIRTHHFITGFGPNQDGGDILGDAVLTRSILLGADFNNVMDQLLFPEFCIKDQEIDRVLKQATRVLSDPVGYQDTVDKAQKLATELISFETISGRLNEFLQLVGATPVPV